ncbi:MAG: transcriptional repressor [Candidatus Nealsonbacteria bacterium]|nr:transcriptional repressor [Candidatus Nealsonbacteria bacterium]
MPHRKLQRNTPQRRVILEELRNVTSHPTAVELYELVRQRMPKISLGTVYRNLDLLAQQGTIQKHALGGAEARFDGSTHRHYHVRCDCCGRMDDLDGIYDNLVGEQPAQAVGYQILGCRLELIGICSDCRRRENTSNENKRECRTC